MKQEVLSGLQILQAIIDGELPHPSIAAAMPMIFREVELGRVLFEAMANESHLNPMGGVHGGFASTVLDSVTGCAVHSMLEAGIPFATIDLNVKMVKPVPQNETLTAEGKVINISRSLGISEGQLRNDSGQLLAHATATCMIIRR